MSDKLWFTRKEFCAKTGFSNQRLGQLIKAGKVRPEHLDNRGPGREKTRVKMGDALQDIADSLIVQNRAGNVDHAPLPEPNRTAGGMAGPTLANAQRIKAQYDAALRKLEYETKAGALVKKAKVTKDAFDTARIVRDAILDIPNRISAELAGMMDAHLISEKLVLELTTALEELSA